MRERKKNKIKFIITLVVVLIFFVGIFLGGYLIIDKKMVPNYLGKYGINNLHELVDLANAMYKLPKEKDFITNGFTETDSAEINKSLALAGYPSLQNGKIDYTAIWENSPFTRVPDPSFTDDFLLVKDSGIAVILDDIIKSNILTSTPNLNYLNTTSTSIDVKQLKIQPAMGEKEILPNLANIQIIIKLDTASLRSTMAKNLDTPTFLIDWLIPDVMYFSASFDVKNLGENNFEFTNATLSVNTKDSASSVVLLNLLISFIYPENLNVTIESLATEFGHLFADSISLISNDSSMVVITTKSTTKNGIKLTF